MQKSKLAARWGNPYPHGVLRLRTPTLEERTSSSPELHFREILKENIAKETPTFVEKESLIKGRLSPLFPMMIADSHEHSTFLKDTRKLLKSHAIELETKLRECLVQNVNGTYPNASVINVCSEILSQIAVGPGPYQRVLTDVSRHLKSAIYVEPGSVLLNAQNINLTYFHLCEHLKAEIRKLQQEKAKNSERIQALEIKNKNQEDIEGPDADIASESGQNKIDGSEDGEDPTENIHHIHRNQDPMDETVSDDAHDGKEQSRTAKSNRAMLKRNDLELKAKVVVLQQDLEENVHSRREAEKVATDLKGAFLRLKRDYIELQDRLQASEHQCKTLFIKLQEMHPRDDLERGLDEELSFEEFRNSSSDSILTPRPNWYGIPSDIKVACNLMPGKEHTAPALKKLVLGFRKLQKQKASDAEDETLEMDAKSPGEEVVLLKRTSKIIPCLGTGPDVPIYLRFHGYVRNRHMSKRDAERTIRDIWNQKMLSDKDNEGAKQSMAEFFYSYARKKFGTFPNMIAEWSYNLISVLERNAVDNDCDLFLKVLRGFLSEDVYYQQIEQISECEKLAVECDRMLHGGSVQGIANKQQFITMLQQKFGKSKVEMAALKKALDNVYGKAGETFHYATLFAEDREMNQNEFGETFRDQMLKEREEQNALILKTVEEVRDVEDKVKTKELREAFHLLGLSEVVINKYMHRGCGIRSAHGATIPEHMEADQFLVNCGIEAKPYLRI